MPHAPSERTLPEWQAFVRNMDRNERRSQQRRKRRLPIADDETGVPATPEPEQTRTIRVYVRRG